MKKKKKIQRAWPEQIRNEHNVNHSWCLNEKLCETQIVDLIPTSQHILCTIFAHKILIDSHVSRNTPNHSFADKRSQWGWVAFKLQQDTDD